MILGLATGAAAIALLSGLRQAALGLAVGAPVGLLNSWITLAGVRKGAAAGPAKEQAWILGGSAVRLVLATATLLISARYGAQFLIGVLAGLVLEAFSYLAEVPALLRKRGGGS